MSAHFDDTLSKALEMAKAVLHADILTSKDLFGALLHTDPYTGLYPELQKNFPLPQKLETPKSKVQTSSELKKLLKSSMEDGVISAEHLFSKLLHSEDLFTNGTPIQKRLLKESQQLHHLRTYQNSEERTDLMRSLSNYGRIISNKGKVIKFQGKKGQVSSSISKSRTKVSIGGKEAKRGELKAGMECAIEYNPGHEEREASKVDCK